MIALETGWGREMAARAQRPCRKPRAERRGGRQSRVPEEVDTAWRRNNSSVETEVSRPEAEFTEKEGEERRHMAETEAMLQAIINVKSKSFF